jgi:hypothetical protein
MSLVRFLHRELQVVRRLNPEAVSTQETIDNRLHSTTDAQVAFHEQQEEVDSNLMGNINPFSRIFAGMITNSRGD